KQVDCFSPDEELQTPGSSRSTTARTASEAYTARIQIQQNRMRRLSTALGISKPLPPPVLPQSYIASHLTIDLNNSTPSHERIGWKPIEVELPLPDQAGPTTYRISKPIPLSPKQLDYLRIEFRLTERPAPYERTCARIFYGKRPRVRVAAHKEDWTPNPLGVSAAPFT
ncbi:hypothetical protein FRC01_002876, partial [Tulasnella sp. 417]